MSKEVFTWGSPTGNSVINPERKRAKNQIAGSTNAKQKCGHFGLKEGKSQDEVNNVRGILVEKLELEFEQINIHKAFRLGKKPCRMAVPAHCW
jgi:hypothetical protein